MRLHRAAHALLPVASLLWAAAPSAENLRRDDRGAPVFSAPVVAIPPRLDGVLDDPVWAAATRIDDFFVVDFDRVPTEATAVFFASDSLHLYIAARMSDTEPGRIRMAETKRDGNFGADDYLTINLDVQHLHADAYGFTLTPRGTQATYIPDGSPSKVEWQGDWLAATSIDSTGWTAEIMIPKVIFGLPAGERAIGVNVLRWLPRLREQSRWPNMGRNWDYTKTGNWEGIVWPPGRRRPAFMPYFVAEWDRGDRSTYGGLDMKYTTGNGLTVLGTIYPDYRNIESGILGLDFSYNEQSRADNRPFVTEGSAYSPKDWIFYSQRVGEMYGGAKVFGQLGRNRVGLLTAYDRNDVLHTAGKWEWAPTDSWSWDQHMAWRHGPADAPHPPGTPAATDHLMFVSIGMYMWQKGDQREYISWQGGFTKTASDTANGYDLELHWNRSEGNGTPGYAIGMRLLSDGFIPIEGLLNPQDAGQRDISASIDWEKISDRHWFPKMGLWLQGKYAQRLNGNLYHKTVTLDTWTEITPDVATGFVAIGRDRPPYVDKTLETWLDWNRRSFGHGGGLRFVFGNVIGTDYRLVSISQSTRIGTQMSLSANAEGVRHVYPVGHADRPLGGTDDRYQLIGTVQFDITPEHSVSGRLVQGTGGRNGYATYQQMLRRGYDLFVIVGDPSADTWTRRVALKAVAVL